MKRRYQTLDGLRGVGALFVVLYHFASDYGVPAPAHGYLAVDLFFCLSGFVLTRGYARKLLDGMKFSTWMGVRLRRLYPLYLLSIVAGFIASLDPRFPGGQLDGGQHIVALFANLLMLPAPTAMKAAFPLNFVAWSLFVEMLLSIQFYWSAKAKDGAIWLMLIAGATGLIGLRLYVGYVGGGYAWDDLPMGCVRGIFSFSAGMLIARKTTGAHRTGIWAWAPLAVAAGLLGANPPHGTAYDLLMILAAFPMLVLAAVHLEPTRGDLFELAGNVSYSCYALHWTTFMVLGLLLPHEPLAGAMALGLFLCLCALLDRYYDAPIRRLLSPTAEIGGEHLAGVHAISDVNHRIYTR